MKRKSFIHYPLFFSAALILTACTLYMDDFEEGRILRTGTGYQEPETMELTEAQGSVTYQYNQNTIPIDDEVEQYIVKVENDTILYFSEATPEELLPVVGEMMTCSFRDKFPNGFCHRCTERTESGDTYRCVFTPCDIFEAFDVFKAHVEKPKAIAPEGVTLIPAEEFDSLMDATLVDDEATIPAGTRGISSYNSGKTTVATLPISLPWIDVEVQALPGYNVAKGSCRLSAEIEIGGWFTIDIDDSKKHKEIGGGLLGSLTVQTEQLVSMGVRVAAPLSIPLFGAGFDIGVVGFKIGLTGTPYMDVRRQRTEHYENTYGFDIGIMYTEDGVGDDAKWNLSVENSKTKKVAGKNLVYAEDKELRTGLDINYQAGIDINLGVSGSFMKVGKLGAGIGCLIYGSFDQKIDKNILQTAEEFRTRNSNFPTWIQGYVGVDAAFIVGISPYLKLDPRPLDILKIPWAPVSMNKTSIYCSNFKPQTYTMKGELKERGLLSWLFGMTPVMRVYTSDSKYEQASFNLDWKDNDEGGKKFSKIAKFSDLRFNEEYIAQLSMNMHAASGDFYFPIEEVPLHTAVPTVELKSVTLMQTLTPANGSAAELANPSIIARNGSNLGWVFQGHIYNYRFKLDAVVTVGGGDKTTLWGLSLADNYASSREFKLSRKTGVLSKTYKVRMTWYTSQPELYLTLTPFVNGYNEDKDGNLRATGDKLYGNAALPNIPEGKKNYIGNTYKYSPMLDIPFSPTASSPDFEVASRQMTDNEQVHITFDSTPFADAVLGDVELIPIE